jgi:hypothetical protein
VTRKYRLGHEVEIGKGVSATAESRSGFSATLKHMLRRKPQIEIRSSVTTLKRPRPTPNVEKNEDFQSAYSGKIGKTFSLTL